MRNLSIAGSNAVAPGDISRGREQLLTPVLLLRLLGVVALATISSMVGAYDIVGRSDGARMFLLTHIPRTVSLVLTGAAMAMCCLVMQQLTQNRAHHHRHHGVGGTWPAHHLHFVP